jgi:Zn-dependent protease with chaperone function/tetratricopeptide (TPR) repeat protein
MNLDVNNTSWEKPLSRGAKFMLVLGVGAVMFSFYVLSALAVLLLAFLILCEFLICLCLARFGAARLMTPILGKHLAVLAMVVKSFRLKKGVEFRIPLRAEDAPALHELLGRLCQRLALAFPQETVLQMGDGAWVNLRGLCSGAGKTTLGVGYDLLAGLSVAEIEAVMAHEMTHAKLIHRGFRNWLMAGQSRLRILANALWAEVSAARRTKSTSEVAHILFLTVDRLVRLSTRLVAAYSRQDEFEADRGAAKLCGSAVMKSALSKLDSLHRITSRLPWNERVAQLQQSGGYSQWLLQEIAHGNTVPAEDSNLVLYNKYSTHPLIRDRLAALPLDDILPATNSPPGIQLLAHPDEMAIKLVSELQRLMAEQEKKDSKALEKFSRKSGRLAHLRPWQAFGTLLILAGFICSVIGICSEESAIVLVSCGLVSIVAGVLAFRFGKFRDRFGLAVPSYEKLVHPPQAKPANENIQEMQKLIEAELLKKFEQERRSKKAVLLAKESYAALETCDYLRAHVAARACLKVDKKSVEGALALAVACASFGQLPTTIQMFAFVQRQTGFKTFSTAWGGAWAAMLAADWIHAEAMLEQALKSQPRQSTLLSLLSIAQSRRGKLQSSILNARRACEADPASRQKTTYLVARLLDGGFTREAQEKIERLRADLDSDHELMFCMAQLNLLQGNSNDATHWTGRIKQAGAKPQMLVRLGRIHESARLKDQAAQLYQEALSTDHFPEAHLGLGRLHTERNNKAEARKHILAALDVDRQLGKDGVNTWQVLQPILNQMLWLHDPVPNCRAWIAAIPAKAQPVALAGQSFMVYASELPQAQEYFQTMLNAFQPNKPPITQPQNIWTAAPRPLQPDGPVRPGVQGIWR